MAAFAALVSLMHIIKQIQQHPLPPISLNEKQVDSLTENVTFLQRFLEDNNSSKEDEELESRIVDAAYAAEDVIESHIVDKIHAGSTDHGAKISSVDDQFYQDLQKVIQAMDLIKKEVLEIMKEKKEVQDQLHRNSSVSIGSVRSVSTEQNSTMVGFGDVLIEVMDKLTGQPSSLQIIPIVGMGGIGKTKLATNIYANPLIVQHFDILAWVTISQEYSMREILQVLCEGIIGRMKDLSQISEDKLRETLYQKLCGRRYLIVMDDVWSTKVWEEVRFFFPNNNNGSRIMITTRLSNLTFHLCGSHEFQMKFLDEDKSWELLCEIVFGREGCCPTTELENIGKKIAKNCRGLPLSIVVIGGLLKSEMIPEYWDVILKDLNSLINLENNEHCLQILRTSYKELPIHLKPCFLYMGVFPEDGEIRLSKVIKLWVAEGFLKLIDDKISLEEVAKEYFKKLVDRNLILVHELSLKGNVRLFKIHDLLRDLCLREAEKQKFLCILRQPKLKTPQGINTERRICIHDDIRERYSSQMLDALESAPLTRSLLFVSGSHEHSSSFSFRLLRVYSRTDGYNINWASHSTQETIFRQANLRYLSIGVNIRYLYEFPSSLLSLLWNLQTFEVVNHYISNVAIALSEIWRMPLLRHLLFSDGLELPDPPSQEDTIVLENLQTLSWIHNFKCSEKVVERIPNVKKLKLMYMRDKQEELPNYCLNNLGHLRKLEYLSLYFKYVPTSDREILRSHLVQNLALPHSLKGLTLCGTYLHWDDLTTMIGSLPLEVLKLKSNACIGTEWETVEGKFCSLKILLIEDLINLKYWTTDSAHFPRLERLVLHRLRSLEEVPSSIGDIPTLQTIQLVYCSKSATDSAERIKEEQEYYGNEGLRVQIEGYWKEDKDKMLSDDYLED